MKAIILLVVVVVTLAATQVGAYWDPCWFTVPWCDLQDS